MMYEEDSGLNTYILLNKGSTRNSSTRNKVLLRFPKTRRRK